MLQRYVEQLIEDLEEAAKNPPPVPYIEPPTHLENDLWIAELALVPFKTIEEWTGIKHEVFPEMISLNVDQIRLLNAAIFKLLKSINVDLVDKPTDLPDELLYDIITQSWEDYVQYLPSSGFDWELCSGEPQTCPYGEFCDCGDEFFDEED